MRQHGVGTDPRGAEGKRAVLVDGAADDFGILLLGNRYRFATDHRLVDEGMAFFNDAIHRDTLARAGQDAIAGHDGLDRHLDRFAIADDAGGFRLQLQELLDRLGGTAFGDVLEVASQQDQRHDHRRRLEVAHGGISREKAGYQQSGDRIEVGGARADHDQTVHARVEMSKFGITTAIEARPGIELHGRGQQPLDAHPAAMRHQTRQERIKVGNHFSHGDDDHRDGEHCREHDPVAKPSSLAILVVRLLLRLGFLRFIARLADGMLNACQRYGPRQETDEGLLGRQIDTRLHHAGQLAERSFYPRDAGSAAHAGDGNLEALHHRLIARRFDGAEQAGRRGTSLHLDRRLLRGHVHLSVNHARLLAEGPLHPSDAGRTGHTPNLDIDVFRHYCGLLAWLPAGPACALRDAGVTLPAATTSLIRPSRRWPRRWGSLPASALRPHIPQGFGTARPQSARDA